MQHILSFLFKNKFFILFLFLEIVALSLTIQSHSYHRSKFINSANVITGGIYDNFNHLDHYLNLKTFNEQLAKENTTLKNKLSELLSKDNQTSVSRIDSLKYNAKYKYINAHIIKNEYFKSNNRLTINKGVKDGVTSELGVVSSKGIVGIVTNTSAHYAVVMPVINENSRINAKFLHNNHFGTLTWNGEDYNTVQLEDLPIQTKVKVGDTIITGGKSTIFPEGILIGRVKDFKLKNNKYDKINITLFNDMSALYHINIIKNLDKKEILELENE